MLGLIVLILLAVGIIVWSFQGSEVQTDRFRRRVPAMLGSVFVFFGFFVFGWIKFAPQDFVTSMLPALIEGITVWLVGWLFGLTDVFQSTWIHWITQFSSLPGWLLIVVLPARQLALRLLLASIGLFAVINVVWAALSAALNVSSWLRGVNLFLGIIALMQAFSLFFFLPTIDAWGTSATYWPAFTALLLGAQMGIGVWITWVGLLMLAFDHLMDGVDSYASAGSGHPRPEPEPLNPYTSL